MSRNNQQKKREQLRKKKRERDRRRRREVLVRLHTGGDDSFARRRPVGWPGETPEDVAVFDAEVRASLPAELAEQAQAVYEAMELASDFRAEEANARLSHIPRQSPYSQWRLLIRGLADWNRGQNLAEACQSWDRLERSRRPGRIAAALKASHRADLESAIPQQDATPASPADFHPLDESLLRAARLVRQICVERPSIRRAEIATSRREKREDMLLGPEKLEWLRKFCAEFAQTDGELVAALQRLALHRAYAQPYVDIFQRATRSIPGPPHDRNNLLLSFFYHRRFQNGDSKAARYLQNYLATDLPQNNQISQKLRGALISQCYLNEAGSGIDASRVNAFASFFRQPFSSEPKQGWEAKISSDLKNAIVAYPANSGAHEVRVAWLKSQIDADGTVAAKRNSLRNELFEAMKLWSASVPDAVEPRLWLLDYLLENQRLSEAKPHIEWLRMARHEDPRVRSAPWKWHLLEAGRLCRRKAWLPQVPAALDAAEATWPAWLSQDWLPYLRAALSLRSGATSDFEHMRDAICQSRGIQKNGLTDACMMLAAAQRMGVVAADLAPLRQPVEAAGNSRASLDLDDLVSAGGFFWDLWRASLVYPAYRNHGSKFARELTDRLKRSPEIARSRLDDDGFQNTVLWLSEHRFGSANYVAHCPGSLSTAEARRVPKIAAARLNAVLKTTYRWEIHKYVEEADLVRAAAQTERDSYYRFWFASLADQALAAIAKKANPNGLGGSLAHMFELLANQLDDEDNDDLDCNCPACTAARRATSL